MLAWNVNGVRTHEEELYQLLKETRPDVMVLCEKRADVQPNFAIIWPGAVVEQVLPLKSKSAPTRGGVAVVVKPGRATSLLKRMEVNSNAGEGLIQAVKINVRDDVCLVGIYVSGRTKEADLATALLNMKG